VVANRAIDSGRGRYRGEIEHFSGDDAAAELWQAYGTDTGATSLETLRPLLAETLKQSRTDPIACLMLEQLAWLDPRRSLMPLRREWWRGWSRKGARNPYRLLSTLDGLEVEEEFARQQSYRA
jgi:hypothetical protein